MGCGDTTSYIGHRELGRAPHPPKIPLSPLVPQFVPFRDYVEGGSSAGLSMARLARDVLAEIPDQLISYMKARGIKPQPATPSPDPPGPPVPPQP